MGNTAIKPRPSRVVGAALEADPTTRFNDLLPVFTLSKEHQPNKFAQAHPYSLGKAKGEPPIVLVADDEAIVAETLVDILNDGGFNAVAVNDGTSAVESARSMRPDIVLADVLMPGINGIEAAKKIRQFSPETRIILFSGHAETTELLARARREGYTFEVLAKPLNPVALLKILRTDATG